MKTIYLAGPIFGCSDQEARAWREMIKVALKGRYRFRDPMDRDYRGQETHNVRRIVWRDLWDISRSNVVFVWAQKPSWGTAMEIVYARLMRKRVVAVVRSPVSPWLQYHAEIVETLGDAVVLLAKCA